MGLLDWLVSKPLPEGTFAVDKVAPATEPRAVERMHEALRRSIPNFESCSDYHHTVLAEIDYHPLLAAVYTAFSEHRPLVLTPDAVWLTIAQGVAQHMAIHDPERAYPGEPPVLALRFMELLERLLGCGGGKLYWEEADFQSYGDAEDFTRRRP